MSSFSPPLHGVRGLAALIWLFRTVNLHHIPAAFAPWVSLLMAVHTSLLLLLCHNGPLSHIFGCRPLVFLGQISFSLYLWHTPVKNNFGHYFNDSIVGSWLLLLLAITLATLSYYAIEAPGIALGKKLTRFILRVQTTKQSRSS